MTPLQIASLVIVALSLALSIRVELRCRSIERARSLDEERRNRRAHVWRLA